MSIKLQFQLLDMLKGMVVMSVALAILFTTQYSLAYAYSVPNFIRLIQFSYTQEDFENFVLAQELDSNAFMVANTALSFVPAVPSEQIISRIKVPITAYSSTPDQTYGNPFITASGTHVRDGVVAANFLPIGTKVRIPAYYGDKVFVVEDRMNARYWHRVDIWMPTRAQALQFGIRTLEIEVLN